MAQTIAAFFIICSTLLMIFVYDTILTHLLGVDNNWVVAALMFLTIVIAQMLTFNKGGTQNGEDKH